MINLDYIIKFDKFMDIFNTQISVSEIDGLYGSILKVFIYYVWRGISMSWIEIRNPQKIRYKNLAPICVATYKSFLPIIQNIRLGYQAEALILIRSLIERISLMGFLNANPNLIPRYINNNENFNDKAFSWAKSTVPNNTMKIYGLLSDITHAKKGGMALYLFDNRSDGEAIRYIFSNHVDATMIAQIIILLWNEMEFANSLFFDICGYTPDDRLTIDKIIFNYLDIDEINNFIKFFRGFKDNNSTE